MRDKSLNFRFTDNRLRKITHPGGEKRTLFYDAEQPKLALQLTANGTKTFQFRSWDSKKERTVVKAIGKYPTVTINQARKLTAALLVDASNGIDIIERERSVRNEATLDELFAQWLKNAKNHKKSWVDDVKRYNQHVKPTFGSKKLSWFTRDKVRDWHRQLTEKVRQRKSSDGQKVKITPTTANRVLALLKTIFNQERPDQANPCIGVKMFKETSRDRFLQPSELKRFFESLNQEDTSEILRDYILLSLFTGARRANVLSMLWTEIDLDQRVWRIPANKSKNGETMTVPLVEEVIEIIQRRKVGTKSVFVFPGTGKSGHYMEPKRAWTTFLKRAGLNDIRIHDLRRTLGSYQTITGASSTIVGKTLGHKSPEATAVYARLNLDPIRSSMEKAVEAIKIAGVQGNNILKLQNK
ncbi:MAG: tyrosine-type recombinase/integrase [Desulfoprunum sp.]